MNKILLITTYFPPKIGGAQDYLYNIYKRFPPEKVVVLANGEQTEFDKNQSFKIIREKFFSSIIRPTWWHLIKKVKKIIKEQEIQEIHFGHYAHLVLIARVLKIPYTIYTHGSDIPSYTKSIFGKWLTKSNLKKAKKIIPTSHYLKNQVTKLGISEVKIQVIHPALNLEAYNFSPPEGDQTFGRLQGNKIVLSVGHLTRVKGFDIGIKIMPEILKQIPEVVYIIVGDGEEKQNLQKLTLELKLEDKVIFTGEIKDKKELSKYYTKADVYLGPSRNEGFGIVFLEARAFGLPIVATNVGGIKEAVSDRGVVVEPNNTQALAQSVINTLKQSKKYSPDNNLGWKEIRI